ncbi:Clp R domain-containing protein [Heracleum sosnowskyi]|uniref:Clp R domain-containing protein n=1 Tax=Heracleum sosnowskyi TaxID=360622 RepID=A0AAD8JAF7_9APIA|nr:Clp R domain-containing protein [Heracleum sosnowskyi]
MRAGLSTIQQTLTPEAASVLNHSISEAGRRNHGQTTPLHVAATLLASPSGYLRQACIRSHPNSSHPLQCRALELCFSVALERLPTAQTPGATATEPPVSNALMAALKRAQAHQRRGCPEQQQQPLLAVKVELEQLIISILDDPSVSRVMREASFSSPAVKATIEQLLSSSPQENVGFRGNPSPTQIQMPVSSVQNRNLYLNPRLQGGSRNEDVKKVIDILLRSTKKKNPVLVGDSEPEIVIKEVLRRIEGGELSEGVLKNVKVIHIGKDLLSDKTQIAAKIEELGGVIESQIGDRGIIIDLGDLKWLVEQPGVGLAGQQLVGSEIGRAVVAEMGKLIGRYGERKIWLTGTATCETYMRCQVYHPSMENDWDLQAVPIASKSMFPRLGGNGILSSSVESLNPLKSFATSGTPAPRRLLENTDPAQKVTCCSQCFESYEKDLARLASKEFEKSSSDVQPEATRLGLPLWMQNAKTLGSNIKTTDHLQPKDRQLEFKQKSEDLRKKWNDTCLQLHANHHRSLVPERITPTALSLTGLGLYNPKLLARQPSQAKTQQTRNLENPLHLSSLQIPSESSQLKLQQNRSLGESLQLHSNLVSSKPSQHASCPPRSPVRTDLVLGPTKIAETSPQKKNNEPVVKDFLGCLSSEPQSKFNQLLNNKFADALDADSFKKLLKGLMEKAWWQPEAASAVATTVTQCKLGHGKQRGAGSKGNIWLLFTGPDRVAKRKMASVLAEHVCGANPVRICLGSRREDEEFDAGIRGKTALDRIAEAVRRSPFSVIMLEDIDEADMLLRGSIRRAMERGRLTNSHGREISLGNVIFVLTGNWSAGNLRNIDNGCFLDETKIASSSSRGWQLRLSMVEQRLKRRASWLHDKDRQTRARKDSGPGMCLDLNLAADAEDDGSNDSSDLTNDQETELGLDNTQFSVTSVPHELVNSADAAITFKPANFDHMQREIEKTVTKTFLNIVGETLSLELQEEALQKILGGLWFGRTSLQDWAERVLVPAFHQLKSRYSSNEPMTVRLEADEMCSGRGSDEEWLPSKISVMVNGVAV